MRFTQSITAMGAGLASLASAGALLDRSLDSRQLVCPAGSSNVVTVHVSTSVVYYPVVINQYFGSNTVININGGITININNAPTSLITTVTATATVTSTSTVTDTSISVATPFILQVAPVGVVKRQAINGALFVGPGSATTNTCQQAQVFSLTNGQLFGNGELVSTSSGQASGAFQVSAIIGDITTTFFGNGSVLSWKNAAFFGGVATFCYSGNNVEAIFASNGQPAVCSSVSLVIVPASACPSSSSTATLPSTTASTNGTTSFPLATSVLTGTDGLPSSTSTISSSSLPITTVISSGTVPVSTSTIASVPVTSTASSTTASVSAAATDVVISVGSSSGRKRQTTTTYIGDGGQTTTDANQATIFKFSNGQLYVGTDYVSTDPGVSFIPFAVSAFPGSITSTFGIFSGVFGWQNASFLDGAATFCTTGTEVDIIFDGNNPAGCATVNLGVIPASSVVSSTSSAMDTATATEAPTTSGSVAITSSAPATATTPATTPASSAASSVASITSIASSSSSSRTSTASLTFPTSATNGTFVRARLRRNE